MGHLEGSDAAWAIEKPRPWHRLSVRLAGLFAVVTLLAVGAVGAFTCQRQQREVQDARRARLIVDSTSMNEADSKAVEALVGPPVRI